jgi:hypothetical protein
MEKIETSLKEFVLFPKLLADSTKTKYEKALLELTAGPITSLDFLNEKEKVLAVIETKGKQKLYYTAILGVLPKGPLKEFYKEKSDALKVPKIEEVALPYVLPTDKLLTEKQYKDMLLYVQEKLKGVGPYDFKKMMTKQSYSLNYYLNGKFVIFYADGGSVHIPASKELVEILNVYLPYRKTNTLLLQDYKGKELK